MSVNTLNSQLTVGCNGVAVAFAFNFTCGSASEIQVVLNNANGSQTTLPATAYTVALNPIEPGNLWPIGGVITAPLSGAPYASGTSLTISRILPLTQPTTLSNQGNFYPDVVEEIDDTLLMQIQQTAARTGAIRGTWVSGGQYNYGDIVTDGANGGSTNNLYSCAIPNVSGTWSTDLGNGLWSLALNVQAIVNATPSIGNNQVFGNISGSTATPVGVGVSALLDSVFGTTQGALLYRGGALWGALPPGTSGYFLETQGANANPNWVAAGGGIGTITGVTPGTGLAGGGTSGNVTLSLATVANKSLLANISGGTNSPIATTLSALLDNIISQNQGTILYRAGTLWSALAPGTSGYFLQTSGAAANPTWASGTVTSAQLDSVFGSTQGNILYRNATVWTVLAPGTSGQFLQTQGSSANVQWATSGGGPTTQSVVTGSRALGSYYHNTTGKPMYVAISFGGTGSTGNQEFVSDSSSTPTTVIFLADRAGAATTFTAIVLAGNYYGLIQTGNGGGDIHSWVETY